MSAKSKKESSRTKLHAGKCKVCNSLLKEEIEQRYMAWESPYDLENDESIMAEGINARNIYTHVSFFGLDLKRDENHDILLRKYIDKGFRSGLKITEASLLKAVEMRMKKRGELNDGSAFIFLSDAELADKLRGIGGIDTTAIENSDADPTAEG